LPAGTRRLSARRGIGRVRIPVIVVAALAASCGPNTSSVDSSQRARNAQGEFWKSLARGLTVERKFTPGSIRQLAQRADVVVLAFPVSVRDGGTFSAQGVSFPQVFVDLRVVRVFKGSVDIHPILAVIRPPLTPLSELRASMPVQPALLFLWSAAAKAEQAGLSAKVVASRRGWFFPATEAGVLIRIHARTTFPMLEALGAREPDLDIAGNASLSELGLHAVGAQ
jgi:hypothetical protein